MKVATRSTSAAVTVMVPNSLGLVSFYITMVLKNRKTITCHVWHVVKKSLVFALTGPTAGSDATSIPDLGIVCMQEFNGKVTLGIQLQNIDKRYITLAPVATFGWLGISA